SRKIPSQGFTPAGCCKPYRRLRRCDGSVLRLSGERLDSLASCLGVCKTQLPLGADARHVVLKIHQGLKRCRDSAADHLETSIETLCHYSAARRHLEETTEASGRLAGLLRGVLDPEHSFRLRVQVPSDCGPTDALERGLQRVELLDAIDTQLDVEIGGSVFSHGRSRIYSTDPRNFALATSPQNVRSHMVSRSNSDGGQPNAITISWTSSSGFTLFPRRRLAPRRFGRR